MRVSDYIVDFLYKIGIKHIFLVTGGGAMFLNDAVAYHPKMKYVTPYHEQTAAIAAESYARIIQNFGVAIVTTGPGGTNTITGVLGAWQDSTPCMIISGQDKRKETIFNAKIPGLRQLGAQEVNIIPIVESITKYAVMVNEPEKIRYYLEKAVYIAKSGRPGPVWLDVPLDVQGVLIDPKNLVGFSSQTEALSCESKIASNQWEAFFKLIQSSQKPVIIAGNGIRLAGASGLFLRLVEQLKIPVVTSNIALDLMDCNNPFFIGLAGQKGQRAANIAIQNADLLISIGCRLSVSLIGFEYDKFAPSAKKIVVDADELEHTKKTINIDLFIKSDAKFFINELLTKTKNTNFLFKKDWVTKLKNLVYKYPICLPEYAKLRSRINIYYAVDRISEQLKKDDVIITDAGIPYYMVCQAIKIKKGQRLIIPGATASMGYNLPASIGASIGLNKKRVICITGDGSFQCNIQELQTIVHHKLPIKLFVLNNNGYLSIRITQSTYFHRLIGESKKSGLSFPSLSKIAKAYGIKFFQAANNKELIKAITKTLQFKGPVICEILCLKNQLIIPTVASKKLPDGTMMSSAIDDMFPFLSKEEMDIIKNDLR